ncbi:glycosyltransferase [Atopomonas sediminilitoris]|uniref:glycosyltransferase n=1 Tax=Atopomonas sediminilitoris TaxID=2919919 RepID=UPI001F4D9231|nr:glycosyltransferase [Atopomonas sediminilitoris]MCJ8168341.1 glycosyltransferase [Atopomonas sediminilitoris]
MKVLLVDVNFKNSSTGKIVKDLADMLVGHGHEALVCYGRGPEDQSTIAIRISSLWEVCVHAILTRLTGLTGFFSYFATRRLIKTIELFSPDVVHLHELHGYYLNIGQVVRFLKKRSIPVVWTFHCEFMYTGKCGYAYECDRWKTECHSCPQLNAYPSSLFFDFTRYMFNDKKSMFYGFDLLHVVTPSSWLLDRVELSFLSSTKKSVVYNGIDLDTVFYPRDGELLRQQKGYGGKKVVLSIAPNIFDPRKGGIWVLELAKRFSDEFIFILVGVTNEVSIELPANVIAIGQTRNQHELADYYSMADLFLLTSEKETFSLVTVESLACGTPVVGFDAGAPTEVAPSGYGRFVNYSDLDALEKLVRDFFDKSIFFNSRDDCRKFAVERYSNISMYKSYQNIYAHSAASRALTLRFE